MMDEVSRAFIVPYRTAIPAEGTEVVSHLPGCVWVRVNDPVTSQWDQHMHWTLYGDMKVLGRIGFGSNCWNAVPLVGKYAFAQDNIAINPGTWKRDLGLAEAMRWLEERVANAIRSSRVADEVEPAG